MTKSCGPDFVPKMRQTWLNACRLGDRTALKKIFNENRQLICRDCDCANSYFGVALHGILVANSQETASWIADRFDIRLRDAKMDGYEEVTNIVRGSSHAAANQLFATLAIPRNDSARIWQDARAPRTTLASTDAVRVIHRRDPSKSGATHAMKPVQKSDKSNLGGECDLLLADISGPAQKRLGQIVTQAETLTAQMTELQNSFM